MWRAGDLGGLELLKATLTDFAFHPHAHEEYNTSSPSPRRAVAYPHTGETGT